LGQQPEQEFTPFLAMCLLTLQDDRVKLDLCVYTKICYKKLNYDLGNKQA